ADPLGFAAGSNWYTFVNGDPISLTDPFGLAAMSENYYGSRLGNSLGRIPILGYVLGPVGSLLSGAANVATGSFGRGFNQVGAGLSAFIHETLWDAGALVVGMGFRKAQGLVHVYSHVGNFAQDPNSQRNDNRFWAQFGRVFRATLLGIVIPNYGNIAGGNVGVVPQTGWNLNPTNFNPHIEIPSELHDLSCYISAAGQYQGPPGSHHLIWTTGVWTTQGPEPGLYGQAFRLIGSTTFPIFSLIDRPQPYEN
ncbi:MAG: hypothetical protein KDK99_11820, partial [Verrucomicrobiales bacterium]|nr:hypothetical protein [Verrucomicrobiales bacterium]